MSKNKELTPKQLITKAKKIFKSYFVDESVKQKIDSKINNICGKTTNSTVPSILFQDRTARNSRALIPYSHVISNGLTYENLEKFEGGIVVEFVNNDFFDEIKKSENDQPKIFKQLKKQLGSDDNVSSIISIRSTGSSSSSNQKEAYNKLEKYLKKEEKIESETLIKRKDEYLEKNKKDTDTLLGKGNDKWKGFVFYEIKGGGHDSKYSYEIKNDKERKHYSLFNPAVEYASEVVSKDITLVLLYFALHSVPKNKRNASWNDVISQMEAYFKKRSYNENNLYTFVSEHICLNIKKGLLYDPIQASPINLEDFALSDRNDNSIDISHELSIKRAIYFYDEDSKELLTPANPLNLFWSKHLSNMMQQDFSLEEYINLTYKTVKTWNRIKIKNFFNK